MHRFAIITLSLLAAGCASYGSEAVLRGDDVVMERCPASAFAGQLASAEQVIVGQLFRADFDDKRADTFVTHSEWYIIESIKGDLIPSAVIQVRSPGHSPFGQDRIDAGDRYLLLLSEPLYRQQATTREGTPVDGVTGAALGLYRLNGEQIVSGGPCDAPPSVQDVRSLLQRT